LSLTSQLSMFKPIAFVASFFSEDTSPVADDSSSVPSVSTVVKMHKNRVIIDQSVCADLVDLVIECWNCFGKKVTKHVQHAGLTEKAKELKKKEEEKHKESMDRMKEGGKDALKTKIHTAQHRVLPFRIGAMIEAEGLEVSVVGDDHVLERIRDELVILEEFGVQHVIGIIVNALRNTKNATSGSLIAPMQQTLGVISVEGLFVNVLLSDKVIRKGMHLSVDMSLRRATLNSQPMALLPFSVDLKQLPRSVLDDKLQSQMMRANAHIHIGDDDDDSLPVQLSALLCGWDLRTSGDISDVVRSMKSIGKASEHAVKNTTHKEQLKKLGHEMEHVVKKAASESKNHAGGGEGIVESITKHLGILDKLVWN